ncbi:hypothetical protein QYE76_014308 [Lolium multiflorum]|uniref:Transposase (putative) gypsy type domain-containing protein n=1 Tax=Lolium multiflorum TaxID=4521 RepID=A0AAD8U0F8_LOLMU|nr:hypothetical protein QYE76_014308 [Lolium multiflorum]
MAAEDLEWERSKISNQDTNMLKRLGLMKKEDAIRFPSEESYPNPPMEYRVSFVDHLIRGLSPPIHDFLRGLLFVYGIQLHQLTPNSILHISIFITLCECFLGVAPNWALWKRIFCLRRNGSHNVTYNIGGVVICVRTDVDYFDVKFPDSVQGWRKKWLYIHEESANSVEHNIVPFDGNAKIQRRRSWDAEASEEEKKATEALMSRIRQLQNTRGKELSGVQITAYFLKIRVQPLQARKNPLWTYSGENDANRISGDLSTKDFEKLLRRLSRLGKDPIPSSSRVEPYSSTNPLPKPMIKELLRIGSQFIGYREYAARAEAQTDQDFDLENPVNDPLLDALSLLELHGREIREGVANANAGLSALFPYFFPKKEEPSTFLDLAKMFNTSEDLGLKVRQENMKVAVENTVALVADSGQAIDWMKVGDTEQIEQSRWRSLMKAAKPNTKKILAYLGIKPASTPSSSRPELIFDNYTPTSTPSNVSPSSRAKRTVTDAAPVDDTLSQELDELRQQLQYAKKQTLVMMEQSRKSSEAEKVALQQAREAVAAKEIAASEAEKAVTRENFMLELMNEASADMSGAFIDAAAEEERICHSKLDLTQVVEKVHQKVKRRRVGVDRINTKVTPVAEEMIEDLLRMDADFFADGHYADFLGAAPEEDRVTLDDILNQD